MALVGAPKIGTVVQFQRVVEGELRSSRAPTRAHLPYAEHVQTRRATQHTRR